MSDFEQLTDVELARDLYLADAVLAAPCKTCGRLRIPVYLASEDAERALVAYLNGDDAGTDSADFRAGLVKGGRPFARAILAALSDAIEREP